MKGERNMDSHEEGKVIRTDEQLRQRQKQQQDISQDYGRIKLTLQRGFSWGPCSTQMWKDTVESLPMKFYIARVKPGMFE